MDPATNPTTGRLYSSFSTITKLKLLSSRDIPHNKASHRHDIWFNLLKNKIHLPIDELVHIFDKYFPLLMEVKYSLKFFKLGGYPGDTLPTKIFHSLIYKEWNQIIPPYKTYSYPIARTWSLVMELDRFNISQLYQMRSGRNYLRASKS